MAARPYSTTVADVLADITTLDQLAGKYGFALGTATAAEMRAAMWAQLERSARREQYLTEQANNWQPVGRALVAKDGA